MIIMIMIMVISHMMFLVWINLDYVLPYVSLCIIVNTYILNTHEIRYRYIIICNK